MIEPNPLQLTPNTEQQKLGQSPLYEKSKDKSFFCYFFQNTTKTRINSSGLITPDRPSLDKIISSSPHRSHNGKSILNPHNRGKNIYTPRNKGKNTHNPRKMRRAISPPMPSPLSLKLWVPSTRWAGTW